MTDPEEVAVQLARTRVGRDPTYAEVLTAAVDLGLVTPEMAKATSETVVKSIEAVLFEGIAAMPGDALR